MGGGCADSGTVIQGLKSAFHSSSNGKWNPWHFTVITKVTPIILLILSMLIFWQRISNQHISCYMPPEEDIRQDAVNQYCFVTGTYTVSDFNSYHSDTIHRVKSLPYPGVGPYVATSRSSTKQQKTTHHSYFQWVPFILLVQGMLLHIPGFMWKCFRKDTLSRYYYQIMQDDIQENPEHEEDSKENLGKNVENSNQNILLAAERFSKNRNHHSSIYNYFVASEVANVLALLLAFDLADELLLGNFYNMGSKWIYSLLNNQEDVSPLDKLFPKMSKCEFRKYGPGGSIINYDLLCVLTLNVFHDKVFIFLWFWLVGLIMLQLMHITYHLVLFRIPDLKFKKLIGFIEPAFLDDDTIRVDIYVGKIDWTECQKNCKKFIRGLGLNDAFILVGIAEISAPKQFTEFFQRVLENEYPQPRHSRNHYLPKPRESNMPDYDKYENEKTIVASGQQNRGKINFSEEHLQSRSKYESMPMLQTNTTVTIHARK